MNWAAYTREIQGTCNKIIDGLIDVFDSWLTRAVLGQARLKTLVTQLRQMKQLASRQIELVMKDLQAAQRKALATPYPNTTARAPIVARLPHQKLDKKGKSSKIRLEIPQKQERKTLRINGKKKDGAIKN